MMRRFLLSLATCLPVLHTMAQDGLWSTVSKSSLQTYLNGRSAVSPAPSNYELIKLNRNLLQQLQTQAPLVKPGVRSSLSPVRISLPLPISGQSLSSAFTESPVLSDALAKQLNNFKTYELKDPVTHSLQGRLTITPQGVTGLIFTDNGSAYISPVSPEYPDVHMVYYVKDIPLTQPTLCGVKEILEGKGANNRIQTTLAGDCMMRNYRLAIAATGEYTAWAGSQAQALVYIGTLVNDVTAIYERDASITFTLVSNNSIIFTDAAADPYATVGFPTGTTLNTNHSTLTTALGIGNFDEGLVLNRGWNGGLAALGVVCNNTNKGRGAAGLNFGYGSNPTQGPQGPVFIGTVAHEMAHQFNVMHTMASVTASCTGNAYAPTAYEPGGGSTIMAYAGSCGTDAYQTNSDLYFHGGSILQMVDFAINSATCVTPVAMSNTAPTVSVAATSYTIPISTPFMLTATGADANNNTLYYNWEQMDAGVTTTGTPSAAATSGPMFRSYPPTTSNTRTFPRLSDLVSGATTLYNTSTSSCAAPWSNTYRYDTYRFTPSVSGNYTFARSGTTDYLCVYNLYSGDFIPGTPCTGFINSTGQWDGNINNPVNIINFYTVALNAGQVYTMAVGTFNSNTNSPTLPANYTINVTPPAGGVLLSNAPNPGAGFNYTYVIVDNATGLIKAIDASSDLSNASNYLIGHNYTVYGLSYSNAVSATLNSYVGTSFAAFRNALLYNPATLCGNVSDNNVLVTVTAALSVQMLPLNAYKTGNTVNLKWATASEQNSSHFEIWRSTDGNNFDKLIGTAAAQGNSSLQANYELNDNAPLTEWNYYKVKQFDKDGHSTLGNIARINMQQNNATLSIYPNPVKSSLTLEYYSTSIETVRVRVLNSIGSLIYQSGFTTQNGTNLYTIPAINLSKGIYVVQLVSGSGSITERFVKE
jgi:reprolysin-like metallo-peptidase family M12B/type IX secretion system substrate protein